MVEESKLVEFMSLELSDWISKNIQAIAYFTNEAEDEDLLFGFICWNLWLKRNKIIFNPNYVKVERVLARSFR